MLVPLLLALFAWRVEVAPSATPLPIASRSIWTYRTNASSIYRVPGNSFGTFSYLYWDLQSGHAAVIDASGHAHHMLSVAGERGLRVQKLLQTHAHLDHVQALPDYARRLGNAKLLLHPAEERMYRLHGIPIPLWTSQRCPPIARLAARVVAYLFGMTREPLPAYEPIQHGDVVHVGALELRVLHVPGHSPGSVAFYDEEHGVLFSGDCLMRDVIGRTDLAEGSDEHMADSLRLLARLPSEVVVLSGHTGPTTIGRERKSNPYLQGHVLVAAQR